MTLQETQTPTRSPQDIPVERGHAIPPTVAQIERPRHAVPPTIAPLAAPRNVVLVSGIKETNEELLKMFFENKKRSGGGPVKQLDYHNVEGQATITFFSDEGSNC